MEDRTSEQGRERAAVISEKELHRWAWLVGTVSTVMIAIGFWFGVQLTGIKAATVTTTNDMSMLRGSITQIQSEMAAARTRRDIELQAMREASEKSDALLDAKIATMDARVDAIDTQMAGTRAAIDGVRDGFASFSRDIDGLAAKIEKLRDDG